MFSEMYQQYRTKLFHKATGTYEMVETKIRVFAFTVLTGENRRDSVLTFEIRRSFLL